MKRVDAVRKYLELGGKSVLVLRNRTEFSLKASNKDRIAMARLPDDHFRALAGTMVYLQPPIELTDL